LTHGKRQPGNVKRSIRQLMAHLREGEHDHVTPARRQDGRQDDEERDQENADLE